MNWEAGANCFLLKAVHAYGKDWELVSTALQMISKSFLRDEPTQDLSKQSCSLQYNYLIASARQKYANESDEAKLLKLAMDFYTAQRREKLHTARLELLKRIKIAEEDAEKLREGRYSEIPLVRLTIIPLVYVLEYIFLATGLFDSQLMRLLAHSVSFDDSYRKRCRAFGIADVIGQRLGLEPLPPGTDSENEAIRNSVAVPELLHTEIGEEIVDGNGGTWFPLRTTIREVFSESEKHSIQASMSEYLRAQAILSRRIGTELPEDETSSVDTLSSVQTHPDVHYYEEVVRPAGASRRLRRKPVTPDTSEHADENEDVPYGDQPSNTQAIPLSPLSPTSSAVVSDTEALLSPHVPQSLASSPGLSGVELLQSPTARRIHRKGSRRRPIRTGTAAVQRVQTTDFEPQSTGRLSLLSMFYFTRLSTALSPLASDGGGNLEEFSSSPTSALVLARRWRRALLSALSTICSHRHAYVFMQPVTEDIAPGYGSVVYEPVDLTSVRRRLEAALSNLSTSQPAPPNPAQILIDAAVRFIRDLMLMFVNARMYNSQTHEVHEMSGDMFNDSMIGLQPLWSVLVEHIPGFPALPEPTKPLSQSTSVRASLRPAAGAAKSTTESVSSPIATPVTTKPADVVTPKTPVTVTRRSKRSHLEVRDVCRNAIWSLSSCKPGHGIDQLLDESTDTFWQSDGPQPHCVYIQFPQKITLTRLCLYTDYKADESYTPSRLAVRVGNTVHDLIELVEIELQEPTGWSVLPLSWPDGSPVRTFLLQLAILANHQNGRDTHLRAIRLHSPIQHRGLDVLCPFDSQEGRGFMSIR
ncbi:hypothetical protein P879_03732 [Paragonimus westermani]|uniref:Anaphase-promoting complex subunit 10 n=1 Tax=Paragonimus westermani TaxID=34504 RepID=A0A8T0DLX4_9TREM|nr:hypothetical protein P879_03732 [Paragonimus westermani]